MQRESGAEVENNEEDENGETTDDPGSGVEVANANELVVPRTLSEKDISFP